MIRAVTAEITRELDLRTLLDLIMRRASELVASPAVSVLLWDEQSRQLAPNAWCGFGTWTSELRFGLGEGVAGVVAQRREGLIVDGYRTWPGASQMIIAETDTRAVMGVPIVYQERLIGALTASRFGPTEPFSRQDLDLLELVASQAAIAIENARLFEEATAAEALRELAQLKAEFLNTASHELRTPLSLIHGYAELLIHRAGSLSPAEVTQMSAEIYAGSQTLTRLVDDLLDFSRLDRGRLTLRLQSVPLGGFLDHVVLGFRAQPGGSRVSADYPPGLEVEVDPERLEQILSNLLANALAYAVEGPIRVRALHEGDRVRIEVADAGPGLLHEEIDRVWETFYRGAEAVHLPNRGSGLGLAVVKQLVELHGGRVGVQSIPGQGATFWFTLPVRIAEVRRDADVDAPIVLRRKTGLSPIPSSATRAASRPRRARVAVTRIGVPYHCAARGRPSPRLSPLRRRWMLALHFVIGLLAVATQLPLYAPSGLDDPDAALIDAAGRGDTDAVKRLVDQQASVTASDARGRTALIAAAYGDHVEAARLLIAAGADVNVQDSTRQSAFLIPTSEGFLDLLRLTLGAGANVHQTDSYNGTGLIRAAHRGHVEIIRELLLTDMNVNHVNRLGWTALLEAIILGDGGARHTEVVRMLVDAGADVNLADNAGMTPLAHARQRATPRSCRSSRPRARADRRLIQSLGQASGTDAETGSQVTSPSGQGCQSNAKRPSRSVRVSRRTASRRRSFSLPGGPRSGGGRRPAPARRSRRRPARTRACAPGPAVRVRRAASPARGGPAGAPARRRGRRPEPIDRPRSGRRQNKSAAHSRRAEPSIASRNGPICSTS